MGLRLDVFIVLCLLKNLAQRRVDVLPLFQKLLESLLARRGETVETFIALVFFAPLANQQSLVFEAAKQRVECAFVDFQAVVGKSLAQGVSVALGAKLGEDRESKAASAKLQLQVFEDFGDLIATG